MNYRSRALAQKGGLSYDGPMVATVLKIFFLYLLFLMVKNTFKGLMTYRHLKRNAQNYAENLHGASNSRKGSKGEVFEAEYRNLD